ncbi:hypothetical protein ACHAWF_007977 [Thalassiosira exigua]
MGKCLRRPLPWWASMAAALPLFGPVAAFVLPPSSVESPAVACTARPRASVPLAALPASERERLLLTEPAQTAFVTAEMRSFLSSALERNDGPSGHLGRWAMSPEDKRAANLTDAEGNAIDEYKEALQSFEGGAGGARAVDLLCDATSVTFKDGFSDQPGLLSALGSAICYFRDAFRSPECLAACERIGVSDYAVAHHITDMYHHRNFRGAYTKTLAPSGAGEAAARIAVGLEPEEESETAKKGASEDGTGDRDDGDECLLWSPTTPGVCIHWKSDDEAWRKKRFERIQMGRRIRGEGAAGRRGDLALRCLFF